MTLAPRPRTSLPHSTHQYGREGQLRTFLWRRRDSHGPDCSADLESRRCIWTRRSMHLSCRLCISCRSSNSPSPCRGFPMVQTVRLTTEIRQLLWENGDRRALFVPVVQDILVVTQRPISMVLVTMEIPQLLFDRWFLSLLCKIVQIFPVVVQMPFPMVQTVRRQFVFDKVIDVPVVQVERDPQVPSVVLPRLHSLRNSMRPARVSRGGHRSRSSSVPWSSVPTSRYGSDAGHSCAADGGAVGGSADGRGACRALAACRAEQHSSSWRKVFSQDSVLLQLSSRSFTFQGLVVVVWRSSRFSQHRVPRCLLSSRSMTFQFPVAVFKVFFKKRVSKPLSQSCWKNCCKGFFALFPG